MAETFKILGQSAPTATTLTSMYAVPSGSQAVISTITVANRGVPATFRVSVASGSIADDPKQYLYYDVLIPANDTFAATFGITLNATDAVRVYASTSNLSFNLFGTEVT